MMSFFYTFNNYAFSLHVILHEQEKNINFLPANTVIEI